MRILLTLGGITDLWPETEWSLGATRGAASIDFNVTERKSGMAREKMGIALDMIQTRGLVPVFEGANAMTNAVEVRLNGRYLVGGRCVTVLVRGGAGAAIRAGRASGRRPPRVVSRRRYTHQLGVALFEPIGKRLCLAAASRGLLHSCPEISRQPAAVATALDRLKGIRDGLLRIHRLEKCLSCATGVFRSFVLQEAGLPGGRRGERSLATGAAVSRCQLDRKRTANAAR
ncbi:MAG: hypothetical protein M0Z28_24535 [Rhodospirillales bacterium]|nr:hypothetical protein [Rhodospirillales bacterium]